MKAAVLVALLSLTALLARRCGAASRPRCHEQSDWRCQLRCYTCSSASAEIGSQLGSRDYRLNGSPSCDDFNPSSPDQKFEKNCSDPENVCFRYVDSGDSKSELRGCVADMDAKTGCVGDICQCRGDLCNGSGPRGWASAAPAGGPSAALLLLLLAAVAAILGAR